MRCRGGPGERARPRAAALLVLLVTVPLAGCLGADGGTPPPDTAPFRPGVEDPAPLPDLSLRATLEGPRLALDVVIVGDPDAVAGWGVDFGDGERRTRQGLPPSRITHNYTPPRDQHADPIERNIVVSLFSPAGRQVAAATTVTVQPPANRPPEARLGADREAGAAPLLVAFTLDIADRDGEVKEWQLDFGDGTPPLRGTQAPEHAIKHEYRRLGPHNATLQVRDDSGGLGFATRTLRITPPDTRVWTYDSAGRTISLYAADGVRLASHNTTPEPCGPLGCGRPVGIAAAGDTAYALVHRDGTSSSVWVFDAESGESRRNITVGIDARHLMTDTAGRVWVLHADGNLSRILPGAVGPETVATGQAGDNFLFADRTAQSVFVAARGPIGTIVRVDADSLGVDPLPFIVSDLRHAAFEDRHGTLVALDAAGRAHIATLTLWGPLMQGVVATDADDPVAFACRGGAGLCFVADAGPQGGAPRLLTLPADPGVVPAALAATEAVDLPAATQPDTVLPLDAATLVALSGSASGFARTGEAGPRVTLPYEGPAPRALVPHAQHARLVYHLDPDGRWAVLDTEPMEVAFRQATAERADGLALAYPERRFAG